MPSFSNINYALRVNKTIERRLIVEAVGHLLSPLGSVSDFRYIGFGSMWFVDFILIHKMLRITDMVSIELYDYYRRAEYNKPYDCIRVVPGDSSQILSTNTINLENKATIAWMDYDGCLEVSCLTDLTNLCERLPVKSIIIATVNASWKNYIFRTGEMSLSLEDSLKRLAGDSVPDPFPEGCQDSRAFPQILAQILFAKMINATREGQSGLEFLPIFNFVYADGAPMITVGGMLVDQNTRASVEPHLGDLGYTTRVEQFRIEVPPLTPKEKTALERMHPRSTPLTVTEVREALSFDLSRELLANYHRFYRLYPTFAELFQ